MKILLLVAALAPFASAAVAKPAPKQTLNVAVLLCPNLKATGPLEVFDMTARLSPGMFNFYTLAETRAPILLHGGVYSLNCWLDKEEGAGPTFSNRP